MRPKIDVVTLAWHEMRNVTFSIVCRRTSIRRKSEEVRKLLAVSRLPIKESENRVGSQSVIADEFALRKHMPLPANATRACLRVRESLAGLARLGWLTRSRPPRPQSPRRSPP